MALTDDLARSFFDLWHHLDPVSAARFDPEAPPLALRALDRRSRRDHVAALVSLAGAVEALVPDSLDDEIDQTLLLDAIRLLEHEYRRERARLRDPAFWASRLVETMERRAGDPQVLAALPAWADSVQAGCEEPPVFGLAGGLSLLELALHALEQPVWQDVGDEARSLARAALQGLMAALRDAAPSSDPLAQGIGDTAVEWRLHHAYLLAAGGTEALRTLARLTDEWERYAGAGKEDAGPVTGLEEVASRHRALVEPDDFIRVSPAGTIAPSRLEILRGIPGSDVVVSGARYGAPGAGALVAARAEAASVIRRRYAVPGLVEGWALFTQARAMSAADAETRVRLGADLHRQVIVAAIDLAIHRRQLAPNDAVDRLVDRLGEPRAVQLARARRVLLRPLETAGSVLAWQAWDALARVWPGGPDALVAAVLEVGLMHPTLAAWRHGVEG